MDYANYPGQRIYGYCRGEYAEDVSRKKECILTAHPRAVIYCEYTRSQKYKNNPNDAWNDCISAVDKALEIKDGNSVTLMLSSIMDLPATNGDEAADVYVELLSMSGLYVEFLDQPYLDSFVCDKDEMNDFIDGVKDVVWNQCWYMYNVEIGKRSERKQKAAKSKPKQERKKKSKIAMEVLPYVREHSRKFGGKLTDEEIVNELAKIGVNVSRRSVQNCKRAIERESKNEM